MSWLCLSKIGRVESVTFVRNHWNQFPNSSSTHWPKLGVYNDKNEDNNQNTLNNTDLVSQEPAE